MNEEDKKILVKIRENSKDPKRIEHMLYNMLQNASPELVEYAEQLAVMYSKIGTKMGQELQEATNSPEKMRSWEEKMSQVMGGRHASPFDLSDFKE